MMRYNRGKVQMVARTASDEWMDDGPTASRQSGIVDVAEREASLVASAVDIGMKRDDEFDIDTDDAAANAAAALKATPGEPSAAPTLAPPTLAPPTLAPGAAADETVIEVSDEEIECTEVERGGAQGPVPRGTLPSPAPSAAVMRSRPPAPPSVRPRSPASSQKAWLPPPRHLSSAPPSVGPVSSRPTGVDPWVLANRTLELSRANARVAELVEQIAYRDARVAELEDDLGRLRRKLEALEAQPAPARPRGEAWPLDGGPEGRHEPEAPVVTETRAAHGAERGALGAERGALGAERGAAPSLDDESDVDDADDVSAEAERDSDFGVRTVPTGSEEDLQQISGIGPRFEAALRKHGVTRLSQIAAWSDADVRQVAKALRIPKSRIVKGRWVEVAREVIGTRAASE
jgi:predicted flap endonuclease-1-like 5' DNA nuclease